MSPRYPTLQHTLQVIRHVNSSALNYIIDIGAQRETPFLMQQCSDSFHHLFEPVSLYHKDLEENYQALRIKYRLHKVALSDINGNAYLHNYSEDGSGRITHSYLSIDQDHVHTAKKISVETIRVATLDKMFESEPPPQYEYLIKLDVDGLEEKIIAGGKNIVSNASFIIIEASLGRRNVLSRLQLIEDLGYRLFDICDNAYYFGQMSQCDLVFINDKLRNEFIKFRPWERAKYKVDWKNWQHGFTDLEKYQVEDPFPDQ